MPETPIDQSNSIQSIRLKVPTGTVPVPPVGFGQLHSPSPGVLALRLPDGSVVEVGPAASGGGSGGIGALVEVSGLALTDGESLTLTLDPADNAHVSYYHRSGLALDTPKEGFVVGTAGRYRVGGYVAIREHATLPLYVVAIATDAPGGNLGQATIQPAATNRKHTVPIAGYEVEYAVNDVIAFGVTVTGANSTLADSYWSVQYVGPATGVAA